MRRRTGTVWLMTVVLLVVPLGGILLLIYGAGRFTLRKRLAAAFDLLSSFRK